MSVTPRSESPRCCGAARWRVRSAASAIPSSSSRSSRRILRSVYSRTDSGTSTLLPLTIVLTADLHNSMSLHVRWAGSESNRGALRSEPLRPGSIGVGRMHRPVLFRPPRFFTHADRARAWPGGSIPARIPLGSAPGSRPRHRQRSRATVTAETAVAPASSMPPRRRPGSNRWSRRRLPKRPIGRARRQPPPGRVPQRRRPRWSVSPAAPGRTAASVFRVRSSAASQGIPSCLERPPRQQYRLIVAASLRSFRMDRHRHEQLPAGPCRLPARGHAPPRAARRAAALPRT